MNKFDFYKELYIKEEEKKNQINNSLSLPIGVITGLVAGFSYLLTTFNFELNFWDNIFFISFSLISIIYLLLSIFHLVKTYSNLYKGYEYAYLADINDLEKYYVDLKKYYKSNLILIDKSDVVFEEYILNELVKNTDINQKNNKTKNKHRFNCEKNLISSFLFLCLNVFPFSHNLKLSKDKKESILIEINSKENRKFVDSIILNYKKMVEDKTQPIPIPTPPPSQLIKEGQDPRKDKKIQIPIPQPKK